jgi:two-component system response regulator GlrR
MIVDSPPITTSLGFDVKEKAEKLRKNADRSTRTHSHAPRIMVVDQDAALRRLLTVRLGAAGYAAESVGSAHEALVACTRSRPSLVITDLRMEPMDGLELLRQLKSRWPEMSVIILTAHGTIPEAVQATQCGAFGFLVKPIERSELLGQVHRAIACVASTHIKDDWRADIVSRSQLMDDRLKQANRAAHTDAPVMLTGESGTGKELFARAIHAASARRDNPFIAVVCGELAEDSLDAELLAACGGTLLLHEIGQLTMMAQVKLVNALQGGRESASQSGTEGHARLICTSSFDLKQLINDGHFREDLHYLINVLQIEVPPLGRRREDIPLLISHFLEQAAVENGHEKIYSPKAVELLMTADWPGNVGQLSDMIKQNVDDSRGSVMTEELVQQSLGHDASQILSFDAARDKFSRSYLVKNLQSTAGNVSKSARLAKRNRTDFYKLLQRYRLLAEDYKRSPRR